jgi:isopentenyldiphosphate isomerase
MKDIQLTEGQAKEFKQNLKITFYIFIFHIVAIIYSAYFMSHEAWVFVSSILLYILFGTYFLTQFIRYRILKRRMKLVEWLPIVDVKGGVKGKIPRNQCHGREKIMHPVVHLHVIKGKSVYLQKRPLDKLVQPGKWDTAVGGHLSYGEEIDQGLRREAYEELGLVDFKPRFLLKYVWETELETELVYCFLTTDFDKITLNKEEVDDGKFWPVSQIRDNLGKQVFTPNFEKEFEFLDCIYFGGK